MFELHTSDFDPCPGRAQLKREGLYEGVVGKALFRGLVAHAVLENVHNGKYIEDQDEEITSLKVIGRLKEEGRSLTEATARNIEGICKEIKQMTSNYMRRIMPIVENWTLIGTEIPIYWELSEPELETGHEGVHLSSHVDALFLDDEGRLRVWDWKWRTTHAAMSDLGRSLQLACYWACFSSGEGMYMKDGEWLRADHRHKHPDTLVSWIDLPSLKPYSRATLGTDTSGRAVEYKKGDDRPLSRVIRTPMFNNIEKIKNDALLRAHLLMEQTAPFIPQGCSHCESEPWCPRYDIIDNFIEMGIDKQVE